MSSSCLLCFDNDTLNICNLPEWEDEHHFMCHLLGIRVDPSFKFITFCDNCLLIFRQLSNLREQFLKIQNELRQIRQQIKDKVVESEDRASLEAAVQSIKSPRGRGKGKRSSAEYIQVQCVQRFRERVLSRQGQHGQNVRREVDEDWDEERVDKWIDEDPGDLAASAIDDFDYRYLDNVHQDPDWSDIPMSSSPTRGRNKRNNNTSKSPTKNKKSKISSSAATKSKRTLLPSSKAKRSTTSSNTTETTGTRGSKSKDKINNNRRSNSSRSAESGPIIPTLAPAAKPFIPRKQNFTDKQKSQPFKCSLCPRGFQFRHMLKMHFAIHTGTENYNCITCNVGFRSNHSLRVHNKEVHGSEHPYKCPTCPMRYLRSTALQRHRCPEVVKTAVQNDQEEFICDKCPSSTEQKTFKSLKYLRNHVNRMHGSRRTAKEKSWLCIFNCGVKSDMKLNVQRHIFRQHMGKNFPLEPPEGSTSFKCTECPSTFPTAMSVLTHWYLHGQRDFITNYCNACNIDFPTQDFYFEHNEQVHKLFIDPKLHCDECDLDLMTKKHELFHKLVHQHNNDHSLPGRRKYGPTNMLPQYKIKCQHCDAFVTAKSMTMHIRRFHWERIGRTRMCPDSNCGKIMSSATDWIKHMSEHKVNSTAQGKVGTFNICDICGATFPNKERLRIHYDLVHSDDDDDLEQLLLKINEQQSTATIQSQIQINPITNSNSNSTIDNENDKNIPENLKDEDLWANPRKKCYMCHKSFRVKNTLQRHLNLIHGKKGKRVKMSKTKKNNLKKKWNRNKIAKNRTPNPNLTKNILQAKNENDAAIEIGQMKASSSISSIKETSSNHQPNIIVNINPPHLPLNTKTDIEDELMDI